MGGVWWENCECGEWQSQKVGAGFCREVGICSKESGEPPEHFNRTVIGFEVYFRWLCRNWVRWSRVEARDPKFSGFSPGLHGESRSMV